MNEVYDMKGRSQYLIPFDKQNCDFFMHMNLEMDTPLNFFKEGDGISQHIQGGVSLSIDVIASGDGKSLMNAQIVRNTDSEKATPVDKIAVKPVA